MCRELLVQDVIASPVRLYVSLLFAQYPDSDAIIAIQRAAFPTTWKPFLGKCESSVDVGDGFHFYRPKMTTPAFAGVVASKKLAN